MTAESDFTTRLIHTGPELEPLLSEHLDDQDGELLAYVLMADVARWLGEHATTSSERVTQILGWLETEYSTGDFAVRNLIDVGIVEMLPALPEGAPVLSKLGPELLTRAEVSGLMDA